MDRLTTAGVILCKNEEHSLENVISGVKKYLDNIYLVDGHSQDKSREIALKQGIKILFDSGKGKGAAMRLAIDRLEEDILIFLDADGSHKPEDIPKLLQPFKYDKADLVIASRFKAGSDELYGSFSKFLRRMGNIIGTFLVNLIWNKGKMSISDSQNGYRAIRRDLAKKLNLVENSFAIEQEMVIKCLKIGAKICEVPSYELERKFGKSRINPMFMLPKYIFCLLRNII